MAVNRQPLIAAEDALLDPWAQGLYLTNPIALCCLRQEMVVRLNKGIAEANATWFELLREGILRPRQTLLQLGYDTRPMAFQHRFF